MLIWLVNALGETKGKAILATFPSLDCVWRQTLRFPHDYPVLMLLVCLVLPTA